MRFSVIAFGAAALLLTACGDQSPTGANTPVALAAVGAVEGGRSVTGHIERRLDLFEASEKYSANGIRKSDGSVTGNFEVRDFYDDGSPSDWGKGDVTCFTVEADGKTARMGGMVTSSSIAELVGTFAAWTVVDNGEGTNDPADQGTDLRYGLSEAARDFHCDVGFPPDAFGTFGDTERANVQVRP